MFNTFSASYCLPSYSLSENTEKFEVRKQKFSCLSMELLEINVQSSEHAQTNLPVSVLPSYSGLKVGAPTMQKDHPVTDFRSSSNDQAKLKSVSPYYYGLKETIPGRCNEEYARLKKNYFVEPIQASNGAKTKLLRVLPQYDSILKIRAPNINDDKPRMDSSSSQTKQQPYSPYYTGLTSRTLTYVGPISRIGLVLRSFEVTPHADSTLLSRSVIPGDVMFCRSFTDTCLDLQEIIPSRPFKAEENELNNNSKWREKLIIPIEISPLDMESATGRASNLKMKENKLLTAFLQIVAQVGLTSVALIIGTNGNIFLSRNTKILLCFSAVSTVFGFLSCLAGIFVCSRSPGIPGRIVKRVGYFATASGFLGVMSIFLPEQLNLWIGCVACIACFLITIISTFMQMDN